MLSGSVRGLSSSSSVFQEQYAPLQHSFSNDNLHFVLPQGHIYSCYSDYKLRTPITKMSDRSHLSCPSKLKFFSDVPTTRPGCQVGEASSIIIFAYILLMLSETGMCCSTCSLRDVLIVSTSHSCFNGYQSAKIS